MSEQLSQRENPEIVSVMGNQLDRLGEADGYNRWMFSQYEPFIRWGKIWEIGSGTGNMSKFLLGAKEVFLTEFDDGYRAQLAKNYAHHHHVTVEPVDLANLDSARYRALDFDTIISTNVLEHIEDDGKAIAALSAAMKPSARLITLVPAHQFLYSEFDRKLGHFRRYTKSTLRKVLEENGQRVVSLHYFSRVSALGWFLKFRVLGKVDIDPADLDKVEALLPILKLEKYFPLPFGQSVIAVSERNERT